MGGATWSSSLVLAAVTMKMLKVRLWLELSKIVARIIYGGILAKKSANNYLSAIK